jgi:hypothetical protein
MSLNLGTAVPGVTPTALGVVMPNWGDPRIVAAALLAGDSSEVTRHM